MSDRPSGIEPPRAVAVGDRVSRAQGRPSCRVALDMRVSGVVGAVAVDRRGALRAWALVGGGLEPGALIRLALERLGVKPKALRVVLGSATAQVAPMSTVGTPDVDDIRETLAQEGYAPGTGELAHAAVHCGGASWLAAGCSDDEIAAISRAVEDHAALGPTFVVDQLFLAADLEPGSVAVERTPAGFTVLATGHDGAPLSRFLPPTQAPEESIADIRRLLAYAGLENAAVEFLGEQRNVLAAAWVGDDDLAIVRDLPGDEPSRQLPDRLELAWRVAVNIDPPQLESPYQHQLRTSMVRVNRVSAVGMLLALAGIVFAALGYQELLAQDGRLDEVRRRHAGVEKRLQQLGELGGVARSAAELADALDEQMPQWPLLAGTIERLAETRPERVGWEKLAIEDAKLELVVSASGPTPVAELEGVRISLENAPAVVNLSRGESVKDKRGLGTSQTFTGAIVPLAPESPGESE